MIKEKSKEKLISLRLTNSELQILWKASQIFCPNNHQKSTHKYLHAKLSSLKECNIKTNEIF